MYIWTQLLPLSVVALSTPERSDVSSTHIAPPLTHDLDAFFAQEVIQLAQRFGVVSTRPGRLIACLLTRDKNHRKSEKVDGYPWTGIRKKKSLRCKDKKSDAIRKA
jgi:hypothetical protein